MEGFPVVARVEVRWRDIDALGHVNNAVYFTYFEVARARYLESAFARRGIDAANFILASIRCDFLSPTFHGETVDVGIRLPRVGRTSFEFEYQICTAGDGRVVARATSTQVLMNHAAGEKLKITGEWLDRVAVLEGVRPQRRG